MRMCLLNLLQTLRKRIVRIHSIIMSSSVHQSMWLYRITTTNKIHLEKICPLLSQWLTFITRINIIKRYQQQTIWWVYIGMKLNTSMSFVIISFISYLYIAGFCDNSLGYVERLNVDNLEWEELMPVKIPRTKFTVVQGQKPHEIMILGGKD